MMGTDPFLWIGIADPYPFPILQCRTYIRYPILCRSRSSLAYPTPIPIRSPINDRDPTHRCLQYIYFLAVYLNSTSIILRYVLYL